MRRLGLVVIVAAAFLSAAPAHAAESPELVVTSGSTALGRAASTDIELSFPAGAPTTGRVVVYAPAGYGATLGQRPESMLGLAIAEAVVRGSKATFIFTVSAADPLQHTADPCAPGVHNAVWALETLLSEPAFTMYVYADRPAGDEAALGALKLTFCVPAPEAAVGGAGAPPGMTLGYFDLFLLGVFTNPSTPGGHRWRAFVTPYATGTATENPAGMYELRSIVAIPQQLTLRVRFDAKRRIVTLTGRLTVLGRPEAGIVVDLYAGPNADGLRGFTRVKTRRDGTFAGRRKISRTTVFAAAIPVYYGPCTDPPSTAPLGCVRETDSPVFSPTARVRVRPR